MIEFDLQPGNTISHFRLLKKLGQGGMGAVFLAEDLTLSRQVAIKFMSRALVAQQANAKLRDTLEKRFVREAKSAAAVNHPNVCQIYEANFDSDNWFIAMECIKGAALADLLEGGRQFSPAEVVDILRQTVLGLKYAWQHDQIIHRDIKPQNLMLTQEGVVKIVDLGLAKPIARPGDPQDELPDLTGAGVPLGTPQYMAPEQAAGDASIDFRADIFALGATVYEVLTGQKAFQGKSMALIYMAQSKKQFKPVKDLRPDAPDFLVELIGAMLEPKPADRLPDYDTLLARLAGVPGAAASGTAAAASPGAPSGPLGATRFGPAAPECYPVDHLIMGRYRILKPVGRSRAGVVYICMDTQMGVECALKSLLPGREFPPDAFPLLRQNLQRLAGISHPNLVQIRDLRQDEQSGELFVVMELLRGRNLREFTHQVHTQEGGMSVARALPVLRRVAEALDSVGQACNGVHHDLKPESIFLINDDRDVKLLDYGLTSSTPLGASLSEATAKPPAQPLTSPDYRPPELWRGEDLTRPSDQYSLAVVAYEVFSRRLPFWLLDPQTAEKDGKPLPEKQQLENLKQRVLTAPPAPLAMLGKAENAALVQALAKDPVQRFASCSDFVAALGRNAAGAGSPGRGKLILAVAAALIVVAVALAIPLRHWLAPAPVPLPPAGPPPAPPASPSGPGTPATPPTPPTPPAVPAPAPADQERERQAALRLEQLKAIDQRAELAAKLAPLAQDSFAKDLLPPIEALVAAGDQAAQAKDYAGAREQFEKAAQAVAAALPQAAERRRQQEQLQAQAGTARDSLAAARGKLAANPRAADLLGAVDAAVDKTSKAFAAKDFAAALAAAGEGAKALAEAERAVVAKIQAEAERRRDECAKARETIKDFDGLDPEVDRLREEKFAVAEALAREALQKDRDEEAIEQYGKAIAACEELRKLVAAKYDVAAGKNFLAAKVGMEFVWLKELGLWMGKYEVTNEEFRKYKVGHSSKQAEGFSLDGPRQPAVQVSYYNAGGFCTWLTSTAGRVQKLPEGFAFRLPTKAEWQAAARCGQDRRYPWGNDWPPQSGNYGNQEVFGKDWQLQGYTDAFPVTCEVEKSGANEWGLWGLGGNVWEWSSDEKNGLYGVFGGGWSDVVKEPLVIEPKGFNYTDPGSTYDNIGFRVVLAPAKAAAK